MAVDNKRQNEPNQENEPNLKGTLISVSIVGAILLISWIGALALFLSR